MAYGPAPSFKWPTFEQFQSDFSNLSTQNIKDADNLALTPEGRLVTAVDLANQTTTNRNGVGA